MKPSVSVIIPTLNESASIRAVLDRLNALQPAVDEVIVVDGGSTDNTVNIARNKASRVIECEQKGRAAQMDTGVRMAKGDYLVFLHADTFVPADFVRSVNNVLANSKNALGGFVSVMRGQKTRGWFTFLNYIKTYLCPLFYCPRAFMSKGLRLLFGDQVMFCRKQDYLAVGGFNTAMEVMEEADLCLKMSQVGRVKMVHRFVYSSDRRVATWGFWKANRIYWYIAFGWVFGVKQQKMVDLYTDIR